MQLTKLILAALPALAVADSSSAPTTTLSIMATSTFTRTITLSHNTNVTATASTWAGSNSTTAYVLTGTGSMTTMWTPPAQTSEAAGSTGGSAPPAPTKGPESAGVSLHASKLALAGVAGMLVAAMF